MSQSVSYIYQLECEIRQLKEKLEKIKELKNKVVNKPKEYPCNGWFIHELKEILE